MRSSKAPHAEVTGREATISATVSPLLFHTALSLLQFWNPKEGENRNPLPQAARFMRTEKFKIHYVILMRKPYVVWKFYQGNLPAFKSFICTWKPFIILWNKYNNYNLLKNTHNYFKYHGIEVLDRILMSVLTSGFAFPWQVSVLVSKVGIRKEVLL